MRDEEAIVLALAADHVVRDTAAFVAACRKGLVAAESGRIVTFGCSPNARPPSTAISVPVRRFRGRVRAVKKFVEKPDPVRAAEYIAAGYFWNSGNFMFRASVLLDEYRNVDAASVRSWLISVLKAERDLGFVKLDAEAFGSAKAISIDYAVMEKTSHAAVVPVACGWSDVGSWHAVWELSDKDAEGNAAQGTAVFEDSATAMFRPTRRWSRWKASTIWSWWRRRTPVLVSRQKDANGLKRLVTN